MPNWVSNQKKYERAIAELKKEGKTVTEEAIKALYVKYGGLVLSEVTTEEEVVEEAPKTTRTRRALV